jgi:VanZ family protein
VTWSDEIYSRLDRVSPYRIEIYSRLDPDVSGPYRYPPSLTHYFRLALAAARLFFAAMLGRFLRYWLPVILWMTLVFSASTTLGRPENTSRFVRPILLWLNPNMPEVTIEKIHLVVRKTAHFVEYGMMGLLVWRLIHFDSAWAPCRSREFLTALLVAALYAASDEFHQSFVPGRQPAVRDVLIDCCGAGVGLAAIWVARRPRRQE